MILGCLFRTSSDVIRAEIGLQLLISRGKMAKLSGSIGCMTFWRIGSNGFCTTEA